MPKTCLHDFCKALGHGGSPEHVTHMPATWAASSAFHYAYALPDSVPDLLQFAAFWCNVEQDAKGESPEISVRCALLRFGAIAMVGLKGRCSTTELRP